MHISKVELDNIKSHINSTFEFTRGTTAITGENGAGKTTIIEAIAWVLFDLLEYKKEDFVRRGAKKGSVRLTFESSLDEREYVVFRDSASAYNVTDPRLQMRLADKKEEVFRFLWQHLGLEPGTDLRSLFRQAIGVPQGTFTAIFLEGATERKVAFDRLLKVEEYRQAAEKLRETSRFLDTTMAGVREAIARAEGELARSDAVQAEYNSYQGQSKELAAEVEGLRKTIAEKRDVVEKLDEAESIEKAIATIRSDQKRFQERIENVQKARTEIEALKPRALEQEKLESELSGLRENIANARALRQQVKSLDERLVRLRESYSANTVRLREAEARSVGAGDIETLRTRDADLVRQLASVRASLERDEKFQSEIRDGLCPILSQKCLNLKPGETLEGFVSSQFSDLRAQIGLLETEYKQVGTQLGLAREAERFASAIVSLRQREDELRTEGSLMAAEKQELEQRSAALSAFEEQLASIEAKLKVLDDPRSRIRFLLAETERETELRESVTKINGDLERLENDRRILIELLGPYNEQPGAVQAYNAVWHAAERTALHEGEKRHAEVGARYDAAKQREEQLEAELARFAKLRVTLSDEFDEKERLAGVAEATAFIRDTLKEAAPIVAKNYIRHVSVEANQMFREITGNAEYTLKWADDYSIVLEEDGYDRPFVSLSGGEQMSAALSVRLALLKQLSDIRIAFFDEPTTNMDIDRRENFAQQISRIKDFDQLFIISHDDTFDSYVDSVLAIGK